MDAGRAKLKRDAEEMWTANTASNRGSPDGEQDVDDDFCQQNADDDFSQQPPTKKLKTSQESAPHSPAMVSKQNQNQNHNNTRRKPTKQAVVDAEDESSGPYVWDSREYSQGPFNGGNKSRQTQPGSMMGPDSGFQSGNTTSPNGPPYSNSYYDPALHSQGGVMAGGNGHPQEPQMRQSDVRPYGTGFLPSSADDILRLPQPANPAQPSDHLITRTHLDLTQMVPQVLTPTIAMVSFLSRLSMV